MSTTTKLASSAVIASLLLTSAGMAFAQSSSTTGTTGTTYMGTTGTTNTSGNATGAGTSASGVTNASTTGTPGIPNTGAGGDMAVNLALLAASGILAAGSGYYLSRQRFVRQ